MDSRFYKKENVKYNLYPQSTKIANILLKLFITNRGYIKIKGKIDTIISELFSVNRENIFYFSSASKSLEIYLNAISKEKNIENVYIPSFSCMELADAIIKSNLKLKVYDIQENLKPSVETLKKIGNDDKAVLILPSLFGKNTYDTQTIEILSQMTIPIIIDEAQAFPNISLHLYESLKKCAILISFGKSKPISAIGGGAIIDKDLLNDKSSLYYEVMTKNYIKSLFKEIKLRSNNIICKYRTKISNKLHIYSSLEELVFDKKSINNDINQITKLQIIVAYYRIKKYISMYNKRKICFKNQLNIFGDKKFEEYNYIPLNVNNEYRYSIMKELGENNIQTTLYYYPIHLIPFYKDKYKLDKCPITEEIFNRIVILPFVMDYKNIELEYILKTINNDDRK